MHTYIDPTIEMDANGRSCPAGHGMISMISRPPAGDLK